MFYEPPYAHVTTSMVGDPDHKVATIGWNLFHDRRIDNYRFGQFENRLLQTRNMVTDGSAMEAAINDYHISRVQEAPNPDFLSSANKDNFHDGSGVLNMLHHNKLLVRVLNLSGLHRVFELARGRGVREFANYDLATTKSSSHRLARTDWLDQQFADFMANPSLGYDGRRLGGNLLLSSLLNFINISRARTPFEPAWVTLWSEFRDRDWQPPERWHSFVGLEPPQSPTWLLLLRYPVRLVGKLVRPTQLEGGWYPQHFPVPPSALVGHTMEMNPAWPPVPPLPEFIHQQIDHAPDHLFALGRVDALGSIPSLKLPQKRHYGVLEGQYRDTLTWTEHPHPAFR